MAIGGVAVLAGVILLCVLLPPAGVVAGAGLAETATVATAADEAAAAEMIEEVCAGYRVPPVWRVAGQASATHDEALEFALKAAERMAR